MHPPKSWTRHIPTTHSTLPVRFCCWCYSLHCTKIPFFLSLLRIQLSIYKISFEESSQHIILLPWGNQFLWDSIFLSKVVLIISHLELYICCCILQEFEKILWMEIVIQTESDFFSTLFWHPKIGIPPEAHVSKVSFTMFILLSHWVNRKMISNHKYQ